jgi:hypothetical protein
MGNEARSGRTRGRARRNGPTTTANSRLIANYQVTMSGRSPNKFTLQGSWGTLADWAAVMTESLGRDDRLSGSHNSGTYNEFDTNKVFQYFYNLGPALEQLKFLPARESSVCLYVSGPPRILNTICAEAFSHLAADEADIKQNGLERAGRNFGPVLRLWWD